MPHVNKWQIALGISFTELPDDGSAVCQFCYS